MTLAPSYNKSVLSWFTVSECQETSSPASTSPKRKAMAKAIAIAIATAKARAKTMAKAIAITTAKARAKAMAKTTVIIIVKAQVEFSTVAKTNAKSTSIPADISHFKVSLKMVKDWLPSHPLKNFGES